MARKIASTADLPHLAASASPPPAPEAVPDTRDDLSILEPARTLTIGARRITVREYGFVEGLEIQRLAAPILDELVAAADGDGTSRLGSIVDVLERHPEVLTELIARAADLDPAWLRDGAQVSDSDGQNLLTTWWLVNSGFFVRRVVRRLAIKHALAQASAGSTSMPASPPTDTTPSGSASTRAVN